MEIKATQRLTAPLSNNQRSISRWQRCASIPRQIFTCAVVLPQGAAGQKEMTERNSEQQRTGETAEQQEHHTYRDATSWARKYLDLADQAMTGNCNDNSNQR